MADNHSKEVRSMNMSHIRSTNSKPEEKVRKYLFARGLRYRKNDRRLPGCPDLVCPKYKTVVCVNGCDEQNIKQLKSQGWNVITIWECQLKRAVAEDNLKKLYDDIVNNK